MSFLYKLFHREIVPTKARLESCSLCQLDCPECFMRLEDNCWLGTGYLKFSDFVKFAKLNPKIKEIELSNAGEMFLNPDLENIIKYAFDNGIKLTAWNGVNLNSASDNILESLVRYKFDGFTVSIDGWNQESYVQYRSNGNFDKVIENIRKLNALKERYSSEFPRMMWKYIIFEHNDNLDGAQKAKDLAQELGMGFKFERSWGGYIPKFIIEDDKKQTDVFSAYDTLCAQLWMAPQINWDGKFLGCCANHYPEFGDENLFNVSLAEFMNRETVKNTKLMLTGKLKGNSPRNTYCERCRYYQDMLKSGNFLSEKELRNGVRKVV